VVNPRTMWFERIQALRVPAHVVQKLGFLRALEFQRVKDRLGLPMPSLIAFFAGVGCLLAALLVGMVYSGHTFADFEAVQLWRMQWLVAALVAFVAGILLKSRA